MERRKDKLVFTKMDLAIMITSVLIVGATIGSLWTIHNFKDKPDEVCVPKLIHVYTPIIEDRPIIIVLNPADPIQVQASIAIANYLNNSGQDGQEI